MGIHISKDYNLDAQIMYCTTTMKPFGDVSSCDYDLEDFLEYLPMDARLYTDIELNDKFYEWKEQLEQVD